MIQQQYQIHHWGPCVVKTIIPRETINLFLEEGELSKEDASPDLAGVLDKQVHFRDKRKFDDFFINIFALYGHALGKWKKNQESLPPTYYLEKLWINYQKANDFNPPHSHGGTLSFVIFLKIPEEIKNENKKFSGKSAGPGGLTFLYGDSNDHCISYHSMFPEKGDMFIFPAWLKHWVYPFKSDVTRISVSGNVLDKIELNKLKKNNGK